MDRTAVAVLQGVLVIVSFNWRCSIAACSRKETALTSSCGSDCFPGRPCVAYAADSNVTCTDSRLNACAGNLTSGCQFSCLRYGPDDLVDRGVLDYSSFTFLVPFGTFKSSWEQKWNASKLASIASVLTENDTNLYPSASNDIVKDIEALSFQNSTTSLTIAGGTSTQGVRGKVANADLSPGVLISQIQLKGVTFANMALGQIPASSFPSQLINFTVSNCLLKSYPEDIRSMSALQRLDLSMNYFADYPIKFSLTSLRALNISQNSLTSFNGEFSQLEELDLSDNVLSSVPESIFRMKNLSALHLDKNSFVNVELTDSQYQFLTSISTLVIDSFGANACKSGSAARQIAGTSVCVQPLSNSETVAAPKSNHAAVLVGAIGGGVALALLCVILFIFYRRKRSNTRKDRTADIAYTTTQRSTGFHDVSSLWADQVMLSLQVNNNDIEDLQKLGAGAFSVVYLVKYRKTQLAASKRLKRDEVTSANTQQFVAEIKLVARLDHPHVVSLIGVAWTIEADLQALFEYMERGDLRMYLESSETPRRWTKGKLQIAIDVIESLVYVHSFIPPLLHRDLKSRNVLLDNNLRAKLSDFGVSRYRSDAATMTSGIGTGRWLAPEVISGRKDYNQACDIWSFGVVLAEMDTHIIPYSDVQERFGNQLADVAVLQMVAVGSLVPTFTHTCPPTLLQLAHRCLSLEPSNRPSAVELAYALRSLQAGPEIVQANISEE